MYIKRSTSPNLRWEGMRKRKVKNSKTSVADEREDNYH